jgi:ribosomal protein L7/L12
MGLFSGGEDLASTRVLEARIARLEATVAALEGRLARVEGGLPGGAPHPGHPSPVPHDPRMVEVLRLRQSGRPIEAIKLYRQVTGAGLAEAKKAVESM